MKRFTVAIATVAVIAAASATLASPSQDASAKQPPVAREATPAPPAAPDALAVTPMAKGVFQGCWVRYAGQTCRGVYAVGDVRKLCGACGPDGSPPPLNGQCTTISSTTVALGLWCS